MRVYFDNIKEICLSYINPEIDYESLISSVCIESPIFLGVIYIVEFTEYMILAPE